MPMTTISRVLLSGDTVRPDRELLRRWAEHAASNGGSFAIEHEWSANQWWITYTINWPAGLATPTGAAQ